MASKVTSDGRIVLWQGASLWAFDVLPQTGQRSNQMHAHHAVQLTMAAGGRVAIRTANGLVPGPVILIAPDVPHAIEPEGRIALLFVEPESRAGQSIRSLLGGRGCGTIEAPPGLEEDLGLIWSRPVPTDGDLAQLGGDVLERFFGPAGSGGGIDTRIARVLDWLPKAPDERASAAEAAAIACLSESRFSHLFVEEVGLPFRTFVLWRRLMRAVERISGGDSLTVAAHHAGFADSAHFSRTFHRMFGLPATALELTRSE